MYIDQTYLESIHGQAFVNAMSLTELAGHIALATSEIEGALQAGGYEAAVPATTYTSTAVVPALIKNAAHAAWWRLVHSVRGIALPNPLPENFAAWLALIEKMQNGELEIPELDRNTTRGPGGVAFTESNPDVDESRPPVFGRESMGDY